MTRRYASIALASDSGDRGVVIALNLRGTNEPQLAALADELVCSR